MSTINNETQKGIRKRGEGLGGESPPEEGIFEMDDIPSVKVVKIRIPPKVKELLKLDAKEKKKHEFVIKWYYYQCIKYDQISLLFTPLCLNKEVINGQTIYCKLIRKSYGLKTTQLDFSLHYNDVLLSLASLVSHNKSNTKIYQMLKPQVRKFIKSPLNMLQVVFPTGQIIALLKVLDKFKIIIPEHKSHYVKFLNVTKIYHCTTQTIEDISLYVNMIMNHKFNSQNQIYIENIMDLHGHIYNFDTKNFNNTKFNNTKLNEYMRGKTSFPPHPLFLNNRLNIIIFLPYFYGKK